MFFFGSYLYRNKPNHFNDCWNWVSSQNKEIPISAIMKARSLRLDKTIPHIYRYILSNSTKTQIHIIKYIYF